MRRKMRPRIEARYYYIVPEASGMYMLGDRRRDYYYEKDSLHFHNYLEIGYCYQGQGNILIGEETYMFHKEMFTVIKVNSFPLNPALNYINQHYSRMIKVAELTELCHISETHFRRCFQETLHMSPMEYLNWVRRRAACEELKIDRKSIYVIAEQCGFPTISTFNRNFTRLMGCSPREWPNRPVQSQN